MRAIALAFALIATPALAGDPACQTQLTKLQHAGLIVSYGRDGEMVTMIVKEAYWSGMAYAAKARIRTIVSCAFRETPGRWSIVYLSDTTNKVIGRDEGDGTLVIP